MQVFFGEYSAIIRTAPDPAAGSGKKTGIFASIGYIMAYLADCHITVKKM
ncbi:hypothetical protein SAMN04488135_11074 [Pollutimonas bauzanensis]|uniref:Uncharacterized protein n=1 Tax=Pollutimonas bauzanensis TaxID=658167 RepID=A0A1M5YQI9_9BURK|nr:hypothetical protein SAMN04488135_11074 [Pollutimonas bauzanensis]